MYRVQITLDEKLLKAADEAASRYQLNRSELVRKALKEYLKRLHISEQELRDRAGYERIPDGTEVLDPTAISLESA